MVPQKHLIVIGGPTASGKTRTAIAVAQHFHTEILSADSRQFYREMRIGTARPTEEELAQVPHHFIGHLSIHDSYDAARYEADALGLLKRLFSEKDCAILVGGSGLFIRAVCEGFDPMPPVPQAIRLQVQALYLEGGLEALREALRVHDPEYLERADIHNPRRLQRALEVCLASGRPFSSFHSRKSKPRPFVPVYVLLDPDRKALYRRIEARVDEMIAAGLVEEARSLFPLRHLQALQTVGYQELFEHFEGRITLEQAIEQIKTHTRRYAKRQMTWFRKYGKWQHFDPADLEGIIQYLERRMAGGA
ncbi:MAG: tRNA dimethylallyltransferase 1 [Saprospiraceae bacterium]|nr:MAG: tRNA dimethylallyltransferase 1 [Saprospiraceae bacterium]